MIADNASTGRMLLEAAAMAAGLPGVRVLHLDERGAAAR